VTVTEVMVKVGDTITADQSIINVEGDKASMEVPAPEAGVVKEVLVKVGDKVTTGTPMLVLDSADAAPAQATQPAAAPAAPNSPLTIPSQTPLVAAPGTKTVNHVLTPRPVTLDLGGVTARTWAYDETLDAPAPPCAATAHTMGAHSSASANGVLANGKPASGESLICFKTAFTVTPPPSG